MYVKKVEISHLKGKCMMAAYPSIKKIAINFSSIKFLYRSLNERLFFLLGFFYECRHFMQMQQYENETDLINKFYLYLYTSGASHLNDYDDENHDYYYNEIDAHLYALNMANKFKNIGISNENIERIRKMYISECVTNIEYSEERRTHYYFNNQESEMTIGQIELYKSLMFRNKKTVGVPQLFLQLTSNNNFQSMNEYIKFLRDEYDKKNYDTRLEGVILHIEEYKIIEKQEIFYDVVNLLQNYFKLDNIKLSFYEKLFGIKINQLIQIKNSNEELDNIINYLASLCFYYSNINQNFSYYLKNILNCLLETKSQIILTKKY